MMKKFNILIIVLVYVHFFLLSTSCSKKTIPLPPPDLADFVGSPSQKLTAQIFIDATVSMEGFIVPSPPTSYVQLLPYLESAVISGWTEGKPEFYKFGTEVVSIQKRGHLMASQSDFYQDPQINKETHIQKVIDRASVDGLTVILTDLFQSDADVTLLIKKLKEKYLQSNFAIGVLGLKSQYNGIVYDVGINAYSFPYHSSKNPESFRPFYVLMLGKHADIAHYFEQLKSSELPFVSETNFIIFSRYLVDPLSSFEGGTVDSTDKLVEVANLTASDVQDNRLKQFRIRGNPENAAFSAILKYNSLPYTISFKPEEIEADVIAKQYQDNVFVESPEAKRSFIIEHPILSSSGIMFRARLTPTSLPGNGIYYYEVVLRPKASAYQMPDWCSKWDMGTTQAGSKTLNLNRFLNDLWRATVQMHQPKIAKFYCYIKKG